MATLLAVQQLHRLRYANVMFLGDNAQLHKSLKDCNHFCNEASIMVLDIINLSKLNFFSFEKVPRNLVHYVDMLPKRAKLMDQQYVISRFSSSDHYTLFFKLMKMLPKKKNFSYDMNIPHQFVMYR